MDTTEGTDALTEATDEALDSASTEGTAEGQNEATADATDEEEDPVEVAVLARMAQEADKMAAAAMERAREETNQRAVEAEQRRVEAEAAERLNNSFADAIRESYEAVKAKVRYTDDDGQERTLDDSLFEEVVVKPMQKFNSNAERAHQTRVYGLLAQSAMDSLPADLREKFAKDAAGKPLPEWLKTYAEMLAPHTSFAKSVEKDTDTKVKAAEARAFVKGQKSPAGTPKAGEGRANTNQPDLTTAFGIADAKAKGLIDDDVALKAWHKLQS